MEILFLATNLKNGRQNRPEKILSWPYIHIFLLSMIWDYYNKTQIPNTSAGLDTFHGQIYIFMCIILAPYLEINQSEALSQGNGVTVHLEPVWSAALYFVHPVFFLMQVLHLLG